MTPTCEWCGTALFRVSVISCGEWADRHYDRYCTDSDDSCHHPAERPAGDPTEVDELRTEVERLNEKIAQITHDPAGLTTGAPSRNLTGYEAQLLDELRDLRAEEDDLRERLRLCSNLLNDERNERHDAAIRDAVVAERARLIQAARDEYLPWVVTWLANQPAFLR